MSIRNSKLFRILSIAPSTRGFGFAVIDGDGLVDWGVKSVKGEKNSACLRKIEKLISHYHIEIVVVEDHRTEGARRAARIQVLNGKIVELASSQKIKGVLLPRREVRGVFFEDGKGTKYGIAKALAERFPEELGIRLPPKRDPWMSEDYRMGIFDAVALAIVCALKKRRDHRRPQATKSGDV